MAALGGPTARRLGVGLATAVTLAMVVCTPILNPRPVDETVWIRREPPVLCDCPLTSSPAQIETDGETEP